MANILPESTRFVQDAYDDILVNEPVTAILEKPAGEFEALGSNGVVNLLTVLVDGMSDYYAANAGLTQTGTGYAYRDKGGNYTGFKRGQAASRWTPYILKHKRGIQLPIDYTESIDQMNMTLARVAGEFYRAQLSRELDISRLATMAGATFTSLGNRIEKAPYTVGTDNPLVDFDSAKAKILEFGGRPEDCIIFISNHTDLALKADPALAKYIIVGEFTDARNVTSTVRMYDGNPIKVVPDNLFYTDPVYGDNGLSPNSSASRSINWIMCDPKYVHPIRKLEFAWVYGEEVVHDFHGWLFDFLIYYDTIIPQNKIPAIVACVNTTANIGVVDSRVVKLALVAGAATGYTHVAGVFTLPSGINGRLVEVSASTAPTVGGTFTAGASAVLLPIDGMGNVADFVPLTPGSGESIYFGIISEDSKFLAVSAAFAAADIPVGA